jgi:uncharacterized protein (TIGR02001 family)
MRLKVTLGLKVTLCSVLFLVPAYGKGAGSPAYVPPLKTMPTNEAGEKKSSGEKAENKSQHVFGSLTLLSNYSYRGITESMNMPALQGEISLKESEDEGFYAGFWGSTIDSVTAPNGNGLEAEVFGGYAYKFTPDLIGRLALYYMFYPQCYEGVSRNNFDQLELIPGFTYKWFTFFAAYTFSNVTGLTPLLIQDLFVAPPPNGNTKRSLYTYGALAIPLTKQENLKLKLWAGYWKIRNYNMLSYAHFGTGLYYKLPKNFSELILSANIEGTTAKTKHWTNVIGELDDKKIRLGGTKIWVGITKEF